MKINQNILKSLCRFPIIKHTFYSSQPSIFHWLRGSIFPCRYLFSCLSSRNARWGVFTHKTVLKIFVFINAMIFLFTTFVKNTPLYGKIASKVQLSHLIFWMLQATKYLIYDYFQFLILLLFCLIVIAPIALKPQCNGCIAT